MDFDRDINARVEDPVSVSLFLDDAVTAFATYRPPATVSLDTSTLDDGPHRMRIRAIDGLGNVGVRTIDFIVANGPGISVTGLRNNSTIGGKIEFNVNAFGAREPFDAHRAESLNPIPVLVLVVIVTIGAWGAWYGIEELPTPLSFPSTPTFAADPTKASALAPPEASSAQSTTATSGKSLAGFDYGKTGSDAYAANCAACHGAAGSGVPGAFPTLVHDPVIVAADPKAHVVTILKGLHGKKIGGVDYSSQMPAFPQLSDADIAAIVDHERTSWGNTAPTITPDDVKRLR
ncbi:MAG: c-type cytochrome [Candidatus Velthaea sp.]